MVKPGETVRFLIYGKRLFSLKNPGRAWRIPSQTLESAPAIRGIAKRAGMFSTIKGNFWIIKIESIVEMLIFEVEIIDLSIRYFFFLIITSNVSRETIKQLVKE